jgi:uncharacterized membrane protein
VEFRTGRASSLSAGAPTVTVAGPSSRNARPGVLAEPMPAFVHEFLNLLLRWAHVTAAIMWVGDSFLFMWMDSSLEPPAAGRPATVSGEMWLTHSGGFYEVVKHRTLAALPSRLHWFMWQSYSTWITGVLLLAVVYALGGRAMTLPADSALPAWAVPTILFGALAAAWAAYEGLVRVPGLRGLRLGAAGLALLTLAGWAALQWLSPRAAFLLVGAMLGTIMTANVFAVIIPGQARMLAATREGRPVDPAPGLRAKARSTHNHYLTLPVLFTMLSNHFPGLWGGPHAWAVLPLLVVAGAGTKWFMNLRSRTPSWALVGTLACLAGVVGLTRPPGPGPEVRALASHPDVSDAEARLVVQARCVTCHSRHPSNAAFTAPPNGVTFETADEMRAYADRIVFRVVETRTMPLGNLTGITDAERATLGAWAWRQNHH